MLNGAPAEWERLRAILEEVLEAPTGERAAVVDRLCADPAGRAEILSLLERERRADGRFDPPSHAGAHELIAALEGARLVGRTAGPYRLVELVATGGMGEVYKAVRDDGAFERQVAVKVIRPSVMSPGAARRFGAERRLLARLSHPNIAALLDGGEIDGRPFLVLEYVRGEPLREYSARLGLDARQRARLVRVVCAAVAHAHQNLIVHRDLKPGNVLVTPDGTPKLLDFGISQLIGAESDDPTVTSARMLTPRYASPEQLRGEPVTTASDVYSLGVILHETLTGRSWGDGGTSAAGTPQLTGHVEAPSRVASPGGIDRELDAIVLQALERDPAGRYPSAEAMGADLQRWLDGERVLAFTASRWYRAKKWAAGHRALIGSAGTVLVLITGTAVISSTMAARLAAERGRTLAARAEAEGLGRFLSGVIESAGERAVGGQLTLGALLDDAVARLDRQPGSPGVAGSARLTLARAYQSIGRSTDAAGLQKKSLDELTEAFGPDDPRTIAAREEYGSHLTMQGRFDEAEAQLTSALLARRVGGAEAQVVAPLLALGQMEVIRLNGAKGEVYLKEALAISERTGHELAGAPVLDTLGLLELSRGAGAQAVRYRERALDLFRRHYPAESREVARALGSLGEACHAAGDLERAESLLRQSHDTARAVVGAAQAFARPLYLEFARVVEEREGAEAAEAMYLAAMSELEAGLPASRHSWVYLRENYAIFLCRYGRAAEALPHFDLAAETYRDLLGPEHLRTVMARRAADWARSQGSVYPTDPRP